MTVEQFIKAVEREQGPLRRFLRTLCRGDAAKADDIAQEALLKAYLHFNDFNGKSKFSTWLYHIAFNSFYDWSTAAARKEKDREQFIQSLKEKMDHLPVPSSFNKMDPEMSKEYAEWILNRMKKEYRRQKRDAVITCVLVSVVVAVVLLFLYGFGVFEINTAITAVVLAVVALGVVVLIVNMIPSVIR